MMADARMTEALLHAASGNAPQARKLASEAESILKATLRDDHPSYYRVRLVQAAERRAAGQLKDAQRLAHDAREQFRARTGGVLPAEPLLFFWSDF
jgi:hypothetical protein